MAEFRASALYVPHDLLAQAAGSDDARIVQAVRQLEPEGPLADALAPVGARHVREAAIRLVEDRSTAASAPVVTCARAWVATALSVGRPPDPDTLYPFTILDDVTEVLRETPFAAVTAFLEELSGERPDTLPIPAGDSFPTPTLSYASPDRLASMCPEAARVHQALLDDEDWTLDIDEPEEVAQVVGWLAARPPAGAGIVAMCVGDL